MWNCQRQSFDGIPAEHFVPTWNGTPLEYGTVLRRWRSDEDFRSYFIGLLATSAFPAYRWETPPVTIGSATQPFEFVLCDAPELVRAADPDTFAECFEKVRLSGVIATFPNLGKQSLLIAPLPLGPVDHYTSLAPFVRNAPAHQVHALWQAIGAAMEAKLGQQPVWLSTAGDGVAWLHVRLDPTPKYYRFAPYRIVA